MTARTLEQILKLDNGLTIGVWHPVKLCREGKDRLALVYIPRRGHLRVTIRNAVYVSTHRLKGDNMKLERAERTATHGAEFDKATENPVLTVGV